MYFNKFNYQQPYKPSPDKAQGRNYRNSWNGNLPAPPVRQLGQTIGLRHVEMSVFKLHDVSEGKKCLNKKPIQVVPS